MLLWPSKIWTTSEVVSIISSSIEKAVDESTSKIRPTSSDH